MSDITEHGREQVAEALAKATQESDKAWREYLSSLVRVQELTKANDCDHENLRDAGSHIYMQTQCKDCNFTWFD